MPARNRGSRQSIIEAVKTPLGFFALAVLVVEALLGSLALNSSGDDRAFLIRVIPAILSGLVVLVALIAIFKPEALWGQRYRALEQAFAEFLGNRVFEALDGYLANLEKTAREEAYAVFRASVASGRYADQAETKRFCEWFVAAILSHAKLREQWAMARGSSRDPSGSTQLPP
jgi:hypothetical protein